MDPIDSMGAFQRRQVNAASFNIDTQHLVYEAKHLPFVPWDSLLRALRRGDSRNVTDLVLPGCLACLEDTL